MSTEGVVGWAMAAVDDQRRTCYRLLLTWLWLTLLVLGIEAIAGFLTQSLLILAEALHTLIDAFSTALSLMAVSTPNRTLGRDVLGHGRTEVAGTLGVVSFLGFAGLSLLFEALRQTLAAFSGESAPFPALIDRPIVYLLIGIVVFSVLFAFYAHQRSRYLQSLSLTFNAQHVLADAWLSATALAGIIAIWQQQFWLDPALAGLLTFWAVRSLWQVLHEQLPTLLHPMAIAPEAIAHVANQVEGVTRCVRIRSRGLVGRQVWIELHLAIHPEFLGVAHIVGERVDAALRLQYGPLRTQIWVEEALPDTTAYLNYPDPQWSGPEDFTSD